MFSITAKVENVFQSPGGTRKDGSTWEGETKVQLMGDTVLQNGEKKRELLTLTAPAGWAEAIKGHVGKEITIPCGIYASGGILKTYIPDAAPLPSVLRAK